MAATSAQSKVAECSSLRRQSRHGAALAKSLPHKMHLRCSRLVASRSSASMNAKPAKRQPRHIAISASATRAAASTAKHSKVLSSAPDLFTERQMEIKRQKQTIDYN